MTTTHDDATTWRDLADQLTIDQITWMENFERDALIDPASVAECLLENARDHAQKNLDDDAQFGHIPTPAGVDRVDDWQAGAPLPYRVLVGELRTVDGLDVDRVSVQPTAIQLSDGRIDDGSVYEAPQVYLIDDALSSAQARALAAALLVAADEADGWAAK